MEQDEIVRRLRVIISTPPKERVISVDRLESVAGVADRVIYDIAKSGKMAKKSEIRLSRALTLVENDQIHVKKVYTKPSIVTIRPPKPPQIIIQRVTFVNGRPKVTFQAVNPRAFPVLDLPKP